MSELDKRLRDMRPPLHIVAPLTFYVTLGYSVFNTILGTLLLWSDLGKLLTIVGIFNSIGWGLIFMLYGLSMAAMLARNNWIATRRLILVGVGIKTMWLLELLAEAVASSDFILVFIWALILYLQLISYIYFTPVKHHGT